MNDRSGRSASTAKSKKIRTSATLLLTVGLALVFLGSAAMALEPVVPAGTIVLVVRETAPRPPGSDSPTASNPIPGIDIIVQKKPSSTTIVVPVDASGTFSVRLKEPGNYTVSTACRTGDCPAIALSLNVAGKVLKPDADGAAGYDFTVGQGGLDLGGQIFVRGAQPIIVNGKSVTPQGIWDDTDIVHGIVGDQSPEELPGAPISTTRSNIKRPGTAVPPPIDVLPGAPVNTSRSNKKTGGAAPSRDGEGAAERGRFDDTDIAHGIKIVEIKGDQSPEEFAGAPINTTRSNIKRPGAAAPPPVDVLPGAPISTTRSNIKRPGAAVPPPVDVLPGAPINTTRSNIKRPGVAVSPPPADVDGDGKAGISDQAAAGGLTSYGTAPPPPKEEELPGIAGRPISDTPIGLDHDPEGVKVSTTTTDGHGAFHFDKLPPGKYKLTIAGQPPRSVTVGADGTLGGSVMRGSDGGMAIFDRWGKLLAASPPTGEESLSKAADEKPVGGFGSGLGGVPGMSPGMGPGGGMAPPGAAPGMSPMGPGAMGPGGGMRP
jgi:hypothetical protein